MNYITLALITIVGSLSYLVHHFTKEWIKESLRNKMLSNCLQAALESLQSGDIEAVEHFLRRGIRH